MAEKSEKITIGDFINGGSGLVLVGISLFTFLYLLPSTINGMQRITELGSQVTGISGFQLDATTAYISLSATLVITLVAVSSLFFHRNNISTGFLRSSSRKYYGFLMIYILVQLVLTEVFAIFVPNFTNQFPFHETTAVQNFVFSFLTLEESVIYVLIPMTVVVIIAALMRNEPVMKSLRFYNGDWIQTVVISSIVALVSTLIVSSTILGYISDFASFLVLNIIFLRFGFLKSFLTNFLVSITNVTATLIVGNSFLSTLLPLFLFFLGFLGVYSLVQVSIGNSRAAANQTPEEKKARHDNIPRPQIEPFIYSRCPVCGNTVYHINAKDMSMKCEKCEYELPSDAMGERNITIELGRTRQYH